MSYGAANKVASPPSTSPIKISEVEATLNDLSNALDGLQSHINVLISRVDPVAYYSTNDAKSEEKPQMTGCSVEQMLFRLVDRVEKLREQVFDTTRALRI